MENNHNKLKQEYKGFKQAGLNRLFIRSDHIYPIIDRLKKNHHKNDETVRVYQVGQSFLQRPIYKISIGTGPINILMWSQMHGDESTATASLFDLINYTLSPENKVWFDHWRDKITLHIVPMLNPDGAECEQRVNGQGIDINRDAKALQTPEGKLLLSLADEIRPQFGFNLHSQNRFYTVGQTNKSAVISLLAPPYNDANDDNKSRTIAKQLVSVINQTIQQQYPHHVGRYDDTYSSRSFGDLFSAKGLSTILIEAGYYPNDQHRQIPRWLTFNSLVESIDAISNQTYVDESLENYSTIPFNNADGLVDLLLKNVSINDYQVDISVNYDNFFKNGMIEAIGDLSTVSGIKTIDLQSHEMQSMKGFQLNKAMTLTLKKYSDILREGYGYFIGDKSLMTNESNYPVIINPETINSKTQLNQPANFFFCKNGKVSLAIVEGVVIELDTMPNA